MSATAAQVTHEALALSEHERAELAQTLLHSLDRGQKNPDEIAMLWEAEISRRIERINRGEASGKPADEVFAALLARYQ